MQLSAMSALCLFTSCKSDFLSSRIPAAFAAEIYGSSYPVALYPVEGTTLSQDRVEFKWEQSEGAYAYKFKLYDDVKNVTVYEGQVEADDVCLEGVCRFSPKGSLTSGTGHFYTLSAIHETGESKTNVYKLNVIESAKPVSPVSLSPAYGETLKNGSAAVFTWAKVNGAFSYDFFIYDRIKGEVVFKRNFIGEKEICSKDKCSIRPDVPISKGRDHFYRVSATTNHGQSDPNLVVFNVKDTGEKTVKHSKVNERPSLVNN